MRTTPLLGDKGLGVTMLTAGANALALNDDDEAYIGLLERRGPRPGATPVVVLESVPHQFDQESESTVAQTRGDDLLPGSWLDGTVVVGEPDGGVDPDGVDPAVVDPPVVDPAGPVDHEVSAIAGPTLAEVTVGAVEPRVVPPAGPEVRFLAPTSDGTSHVAGSAVVPGTSFHGVQPAANHLVQMTAVETQRYRVHPRILGSVLAVVGVEAAAVVAVITTDILR